jgi:hypothetical protein
VTDQPEQTDQPDRPEQRDQAEQSDQPDRPEQRDQPEQSDQPDRPDAAAEFTELLTAATVDPAQLQSRVRRGGATARAAVVSLAQRSDVPQLLRFRAAVLAADACADDSHLRRALDAAAAQPAASTLSELLAAADETARAGGPAETLLGDAAVTADLLAAAIAARPEDPRIAAAVLESLGDSSGFTLAVRPVRSRENAVKVLRNGMTLLGRATDDRVRHALEQVLLARVTSAASPMNEEILQSVLASPSGRGPDLVADLARAGMPGIRRQAQSALGLEVEPDHDDSGETAMVMFAISERNRPAEVVPEPVAPQATPAAEPEPGPAQPEPAAASPDPVPIAAPDLAAAATPSEPVRPSPRPFTPPGSADDEETVPPAKKRSWFARLFGIGRR